MKQAAAIAVLAGLLALLAGCAAKQLPLQGLRTKAHLPRELAQAGDQIDISNPKAASQMLESWIKTHSEEDPAMHHALFLKGRALYDQKRYYRALLTYEKLLDRYASSEHFSATLEQEVEIAKLFLAGTKRRMFGFLKFSARTDALEILEKVAQRWPGSELAVTALMIQADYYYGKHQYIEAQATYQMVVANYRNDPEFERALRGSAEATYAQYAGPRYDGSPLQEASFRYKQYLLHATDPATAAIQARLDKIVELQTEREFEIADFYRRTHKIEPAKHYWRYIIEKWPQSSWARQSKVWLEKVP